MKIILIGALAFSLAGLTLAAIVRAITRPDIDSAIMLEIFNSFIGLFGVVVGYVLGAKRD